LSFLVKQGFPRWLFLAAAKGPDYHPARCTGYHTYHTVFEGKHHMRKTQLLIALAAIGFAGSSYATNGMNLEGYGPIAAAMGGASMAYDNGNAAVMNNPATLGLMGQGSRLDIAVGLLGPDVTMSAGGGPKADSGGTSYIMPAVGWTKKDGPMTYGVAMFAQGGMGTEWDSATFTGTYSPDGLPMRSELGVGRLIAPLAYEVSPNLVIAGSVDYVWAMMDLKMAMPAAQLGAMVTNFTSLPAPVQGLLGAAAWGRLDFSDSSDYTGKAKATGFAGKLGFTYKASPTVTIGGTYHSKTSLGDMETSSNGASFTTNISSATPGKISVVNFQWPETYGLGIAVQASPSLMIAADVKHIGWQDVMKNFNMTFSSPALGPVPIQMSMPQNWDDQTVFQLGLAYKATDALTLRAGASFTDNPIPDSTMNFLFPAIEKNHYTAGVGYDFSKDSGLNFSLQFAPKVTQTNAPVTVSHSQTSWQLMYSKRF
jgi:long-chain fatty acid transport protein